MIDMVHVKEKKNDESKYTKCDENIKLNVDLQSEITNENTSINRLISSDTQPLANISTENNSPQDAGSQPDTQEEHNDNSRSYMDANASLNSTIITQDIIDNNERNTVTQTITSDVRREYSENHDKKNVKKETIETQDDNLSDEEAVRKGLDSKIFENMPLFEVTRPKILNEVVGQTHLINNHNGSIKNFIRLGYLPSMILHGPPGVGKTSIASILAQETGYVFIEFSATDATVSDLKEILTTIEKENRKRSMKEMDYLRVVVFIDEIHRFTKTQQDFLLPFIELGVFTFIGATTLNPEVRIRRAIISRCQIFQLKALEPNEIDMVIRKAILYENIRRRVLRNLRSLSYDDNCLNLLVRRSNGDTRAAVNLVELVSTHYNIKDLKYQVGNHELFLLDLNTLKRAIESLKINLSGLQDTKNLNLFLDLYDSMRHIKKNRTTGSNFQRACHNTDPVGARLSNDIFSSPNTVSEKLSVYKMEDEKYGIGKSKLSSDESETKFNANNMANALICKSEKNSIIMKITIPSERLKCLVEVDDKPLNLDSCSDYNEESKGFQFDREGYHDLEKSYIAQMEVSDDSDVEAGPLYFDREEDLQPIDMQKISVTKYFAVSSIYSLIMLLNRGETPFFIGKQLILFTAIYLKSDNSDLGKTMALLKSFKNSNTDMLTTLSNCVLRLTRAEKLSSLESSNFLLNLKYIKQYCYFELQEHGNKNTNHIGANNDESVEIVYDSNLVEDLLKPVDETSFKTSKPIFEIESLDAFRNSNKEQCMHIPHDIDDKDDGSEHSYSTVIDIVADSPPKLNTDESKTSACLASQKCQQDSNSDDSDANETNLSLIKNPETQLE